MEFGTAFDFGGFEEAIGDANDELSGEKYAESSAESGDDEGEPGVEPTEVAEEEESGDEEDGTGDHHGAEEYEEESIAARELMFGECESGKNPEVHVGEGGQDCDDETVERGATHKPGVH